MAYDEANEREYAADEESRADKRFSGWMRSKRRQNILERIEVIENGKVVGVVRGRVVAR